MVAKHRGNYFRAASDRGDTDTCRENQSKVEVEIEKRENYTRERYTYENEHSNCPRDRN